MDKVRYGIIGVGKMGSLHAMRFKYKTIKNGVLTALCDIDPKRKEYCQKNFAQVKFFDDYTELMESGLVDAVIIATPHYLHPVIAKASLTRNLHTLIEKPAGVYTSAIRELNALAKEKKDLTFGIMYNQRTNPLYKYAKNLVESGRLGELKRINWIITNWYRPQAYYNQGGWRGTWEGEGGGVLINQCPHQIDLFQWLGGMPCKVKSYVKSGVNRDINVENDVTAYFEYPNGATGVFITSTHDYPGTNRLEIDGDKGQIVVDENKLTFTELAVGEKEFSKTNKVFMGKPASKKIVKKTPWILEMLHMVTAQHTEIIRNFTANILDKVPLIAPGEDGIRGLTISNAIHLSGWTGEEVTISPDVAIDEKRFEEELAKRIEEEKENNKKK